MELSEFFVETTSTFTSLLMGTRVDPELLIADGANPLECCSQIFS